MISGNEIYENIQKLSYKKNRTVNSICKAAGVSPGVISDLKTGRRKRVGVVTLSKLATALNCSIEDIIAEATSDISVAKSPKANRIDPFILRANEAMRDRPEMRRLIRAAISANRQLVLSTAVLLESIISVQAGNLKEDKK